MRDVGTATAQIPADCPGLLISLNVGGLAVAGPCPTSTFIRSYPGEPGRSLSATCDPFGSLQLIALQAIPLALWLKKGILDSSGNM